jgi:hypothetical protein
VNDLLKHVLDAHGGLSRWKQFESVRARISTQGGLWALKGLVKDSAPREMTVSLHEQFASVTPFGQPDWRTHFTPGRIAIETLDGKVVREREDPRRSFENHAMNTPWDPLHRAYFNGEAVWTYLTTPFLLAVDGVRVEETEAWREGAETWRVLRAYFPGWMETHCMVQDFFFGEDMMLRRHDYSVNVAGGFPAAQLTSAYIEAGGIRLPSTRRAYTRGPDRRPITDMLMVSIDFSEVTFT